MQTALLMLIAALLVAQTASRFSPSAAKAAPGMGLVNPIDQRERIIDELAALNARLARVEGRLDTPLTVHVKEAPNGAGAR